MTIYEYNQYRKTGNERTRTATNQPKNGLGSKIAKNMTEMAD